MVHIIVRNATRLSPEDLTFVDIMPFVCNFADRSTQPRINNRPTRYTKHEFEVSIVWNVLCVQVGGPSQAYFSIHLNFLPWY